MNLPESQRYALRRRRLKLARQCIAEGVNLTGFARRANISVAAAHQYLKANSPETLQDLKDGFRGNCLRPEEVLRRLRILDRQPSLRAAARELGINPTSLCNFKKAYAPDGVNEALEDYEEAYGNASTEVTTA
ncbi:MAG: hypothetical protein AAFY12_11710 [Pseudomonadota bacterium]